MNESRERLARCFQLVFPKLKDDPAVSSATQATVEEWDSVSTITLVNVIEDEFQIEIDFEALGDLTSFDLILDYVTKAGPVS